MPASLRELRQRRTTVSTTKKITRAMELIAASRIIKAQQRAQAATPYARELTRAVSAVATFSNVDHPLLTEKENPQRAALLIITSDRGLAGAYSSSVIKEAQQLRMLLEGKGLEVHRFLAGRKGIAYCNFRRLAMRAQWEGFSDAPTYAHSREIADAVIADFMTPTEEGGVDEIHVIYTRFVSMLTQRPEVIRMLPLEVVEGAEPPAENELLPLYEFEPDAETVLNELLPLYVASRIHYCLLQSAASELASRQKAMKSATDKARQAEITQEISEIVGGASALAEATAAAE